MDNKELILFGASGDLARQKLYPALFNLFDPVQSFCYTGFARTAMLADEFRELVRTSVLAQSPDADVKKLDLFAHAWRYVSGNYDTRGIRQLKEQCAADAERFFYLAIPSGHALIAAIARGLMQHSLIDSCSAIVLEKPFGSDYRSASRISRFISKYFSEEQIFRIDHYLAKDLVQDILALRFANPIFEPVWNGRYIDRIEIEIKESEGIRNRGQYYDQAGAIRDMLQNHALQLLAFTVMQQPENLSAAAIHRKKIAVLKKIKLWPGEQSVTIGQYAGYRDEPYVSPTSLTETHASLTVFVDTPLWRSVPIIIVSGKKMKEKTTDITVHFKKSPHSMWDASGCAVMENVIRINIQPHNDIRLQLNSEFDPQKKCAFPTDLRFGFEDNDLILKEPYENALRDLFARDQSIFINSQEIALSWKFIDGVLAHIAPEREKLLGIYGTADEGIGTEA